MYKNLSVACVIPARLRSVRFPGKMLALLKGKPLIQWAFEGATNCSYFDDVVVATDSVEIASVVEKFGGRAILTSPTCQNGTERLVELYRTKKLNADIWVNWQGDEPFIDQGMIKTLLSTCGSEREEIWTLKKKIKRKEEVYSPDIVKVVCDKSGKALYFSRSPIPHQMERDTYKHVGIYAYKALALEKIQYFEPCALEKGERLEQLRYLYYGLPIQVHETSKEIFGIDTKEELALAEEFELCYPS